jgi:hypothetical protein
VPERRQVADTPWIETEILLALMNSEDLHAQGLMDEMLPNELRALEGWGEKLAQMAYETRVHRR